MPDATVTGMSASTFTRPERGQELDLRVDSLAYGGNGVARLEGYVVFVSGAMPGDRVRAVVTKRKRGYAEARTVEVLEPSPERIEPAAPGHPGTSWQVLPYERQLEVKAEQVEDALRRIGRLDGFEVEPIVPATEQWRYRNKCEYSFGTGEDGALVCGFHKPGSWEEIVHVEDDMLASEAVNAMRRRVVDWCREQGLGAYDRRAQAGFLRNLVIREGRRSRRPAGPPGHERRRGVRRGRRSRPPRAARGVVLDADGRRRRDDDGRRDRPPGGRAAAARGARRASSSASRPRRSSRRTPRWPRSSTRVAGEYAALKGYERVYDLYCGMGTIGLTLAPRAGEVWGVEVVEAAVGRRDRQRRAQRDRQRAVLRRRHPPGACATSSRQAGKPDVVVLDPPRAGPVAEGRAPRHRGRAQAHRLRLLQPDDARAERGAARRGGLRARRVRPVDMFPQTHHIECVALLDRDEQPA